MPSSKSNAIARRTALDIASFVLLASALSGCAALPSNGPTAGGIQKLVHSPQNTIGFTLVNITPEILSLPDIGVRGANSIEALAATSPFQSADLIRPGDRLSIGIYEVGVSLFGGAANIGTQAAVQGEYPVANGAQLASVKVDEKGDIRLPFVGTLNVAGYPPETVQKMIETRLKGMSQSPQVLVSIADSVANSVYLTGAIGKSGRYSLTSAHERLLDILAMAGGPTVDLEDADVRIVRNGHTGSIALGNLNAEDLANIVLAPGDRIEVRKAVRSYTVFGATDKVSQVPFGVRTLSLSEAVARVGGPADTRANPKGIFLFRFEPLPDGKGEKPVIYRLDMMNPQSYFLAQRFAMRDKDLIYFANSAANPPAKFIALINQLFSPIVTARYLAQ
jgi:polysaccharide export outer membrane protein